MVCVCNACMTFERDNTRAGTLEKKQILRTARGKKRTRSNKKRKAAKEGSDMDEQPGEVCGDPDVRRNKRSVNCSRAGSFWCKLEYVSKAANACRNPEEEEKKIKNNGVVYE